MSHLCASRGLPRERVGASRGPVSAVWPSGARQASTSKPSPVCLSQVCGRPRGPRGPGSALTCRTTLHRFHSGGSGGRGGCCCGHRHGHRHGHRGRPPGEAEPGAEPVRSGEARPRPPALDPGSPSSWTHTHLGIRVTSTQGLDSTWCSRMSLPEHARRAPSTQPRSPAGPGVRLPLRL